MLDKDFTVCYTRHLFKQKVAKTQTLVDRLVSNLHRGKIEHELQPELEVLLEELKLYLNPAQIVLIREALSNARIRESADRIDSEITSLLKSYFNRASTLDPELSLVQASAFSFFASKAPALIDKRIDARVSFLVFLRDLGSELASFAQRPTADGIDELVSLLVRLQESLADKSDSVGLGREGVLAAKEFLAQAASIVLLNKLEHITEDYLNSGTDLSLTSGQVWASRYNRSDYVPFLFDPLESLRLRYPWVFSLQDSTQRLNAIRVRIKLDGIESTDSGKSVDERSTLSLEARILEIRALFGIALNSMAASEWQLAETIFQVLLTKTSAALDLPQKLSSKLSHKISRLRYLSLLFLSYVDSFFNPRPGESPYSSRIKSIDSLFDKARYELQILGISGLTIDPQGNQHSSLDGLTDWVEEVIRRQKWFLKYLLSSQLKMYEEAYQHISNYLLDLLGLEDGKSCPFLELTGTSSVNSRTGAPQPGFFFCAKADVFAASFVEQVCERLSGDPAIQEEFLTIFPLLTRVASEFQDFDRGLSLMIAHRQLLFAVSEVQILPENFSVVVDMIDADIRYRFGLKKAVNKPARKSAIKLLASANPPAGRSVQMFCSEEHVNQEFKDYAKATIQDAIIGQFVSQEIRLLEDFARETKSGSWLRRLSRQVLRRIEERLLVGEQEIREYLRLSAELGDKASVDGMSLLNIAEIESRALAASQMLLDTSLICALLEDEKRSRKLLQYAVDKYSQILPGIAGLISWIMEADSHEEFRRRVEKSIDILNQESGSSPLALCGSESGITLGFSFMADSQKKAGNREHDKLLNKLFLISSISRRHIVAGRCSALERYADACKFVFMQRYIVSSISALNDDFSNS